MWRPREYAGTASRGTVFHLYSWNGQKGQPVRWDVWRPGEHYVADEEVPEPPSEITRQLDESIRHMQARKGISPVPINRSEHPLISPEISYARSVHDTSTAQWYRQQDAVGRRAGKR